MSANNSAPSHQFKAGQIVQVQSPRGFLALRIVLIERGTIHTREMRADMSPRATRKSYYSYNESSNPLKPLDETDELIWRWGDWYVVTKRTKDIQAAYEAGHKAGRELRQMFDKYAKKEEDQQ